MSAYSPFIGSPHSRYAALAIIVAVAAVSIAILFGADAMPLSQKFFFVVLIFLLSTPGILLSLLQLTCLVTGAGNENKRWWCALYSWIMSAFVIVYSILVIAIAVQSLVTKKETFSFQTHNRSGANNFIRDYPAEYPPKATPAPQEYPTIAATETGLPISDDDKNQFMIRKPVVNERFLGMPDGEAFNQLPGQEQYKNKQ